MEVEMVIDADLNLAIAEFIESKPTIDSGGPLQMIGWKQRDFVNDPACTLMLLKMLRESHKVVWLTVGWMCHVVVGPLTPTPAAEVRTPDDIGRAVAEAFYLANIGKSWP